MSATEIWRGIWYKGVEVIFENGYRDVINVLAEDLDIILEKEVSIIEYPETEKKNQKEYGQIRVETSDSSEYFADKVVISVPLAVLKSDMITFTPDLPEEKLEGIANMDYGIMDKLVIYFDDIFWPEDADGLIYVADDASGKWMYTMTLNKLLD
mmetsp:Transcript_30603/g.30074  ORF Transcript_30603/g.30074 Transcript_30603/m.30074 type:complete len:154 (+) Transcript_30603:648-1109(+)